MFNHCHHTVAGGMGALSINLAHLPYSGTILNQPSKLLEMFEVIKGETYRQHTAKVKQESKK